ncbi:hypothetical protein N7537_008636 [Penicillium hordei]|uniref:Uncharacterized protein n=1 Tax=Penicillium hordei TaxID=40994 RepID=A0AAD6E0V4_9EURO|nr:uncharacterized protein N7537_008636 [Penicillium hordei]KAJ5598552.1 hypothetical protein N7537_008636 [Penicillium hordei]
MGSRLAFIDTAVLVLAFWRCLPVLPTQWHIHSSYRFAGPPCQSTIILGDILDLTPVIQFRNINLTSHDSKFVLVVAYSTSYHPTTSLTSAPTIEQKGNQESKKIDRRRDRTCNLLIRSQAPCHWASRPVKDSAKKCKKKSLPRGIEPRSPALIGINDKRKSSPLDQGRCDGRVTSRPLGWLMENLVIYSFITENKIDLHRFYSDTSFSDLDDPVF